MTERENYQFGQVLNLRFYDDNREAQAVVTTGTQTDEQGLPYTDVAIITEENKLAIPGTLDLTVAEVISTETEHWTLEQIREGYVQGMVAWGANEDRIRESAMKLFPDPE